MAIDSTAATKRAQGHAASPRPSRSSTPARSSSSSRSWSSPASSAAPMPRASTTWTSHATWSANRRGWSSGSRIAKIRSVRSRAIQARSALTVCSFLTATWPSSQLSSCSRPRKTGDDWITDAAAAIESGSDPGHPGRTWPLRSRRITRSVAHSSPGRPIASNSAATGGSPPSGRAGSACTGMPQSRSTSSAISAGSPHCRNTTRTSSGSAPRSRRSRIARASTRAVPSPCGAPWIDRPWAELTAAPDLARRKSDCSSWRRPAGRQISGRTGTSANPSTSSRSRAAACAS